MDAIPRTLTVEDAKVSTERFAAGVEVVFARESNDTTLSGQIARDPALCTTLWSLGSDAMRCVWTKYPRHAWIVRALPHWLTWKRLFNYSTGARAPGMLEATWIWRFAGSEASCRAKASMWCREIKSPSDSERLAISKHRGRGRISEHAILGVRCGPCIKRVERRLAGVVPRFSGLLHPGRGWRSQQKCGAVPTPR